MRFDTTKVANYVAAMDKKGLSAQELIAIGKVLVDLGEVQKETDYLNEYMIAMLLEQQNTGNMQ
jgi:hypothetical protein